MGDAKRAGFGCGSGVLSPLLCSESAASRNPAPQSTPNLNPLPAASHQMPCRPVLIPALRFTSSRRGSRDRRLRKCPCLRSHVESGVRVLGKSLGLTTWDREQGLPAEPWLPDSDSRQAPIPFCRDTSKEVADWNPYPTTSLSDAVPVG